MKISKTVGTATTAIGIVGMLTAGLAAESAVNHTKHSEAGVCITPLSQPQQKSAAASDISTVEGQVIPMCM
jgi:hypothetical protein